MIELLLVLTLVNTGALAVQLFGVPRFLLRKVKEEVLPQAEPEVLERPFTVMLATARGASARDCFLALSLKDGETVEFCENGVRRGLREPE